MTERTENFRRWMGNSFVGVDSYPDGYTEGCESVARWEADPEWSDSFAEFKAELAAHIRDSSHTPVGKQEKQWVNDEWLRNLWYDLFGPDPAPDDPYPIPAEDWGHPRETPYIEYAVGDSETDSTEAERAWLVQRGLTHAAIRRGEFSRPEPADYADRLARLTAEGKRTSYDGEV